MPITGKPEENLPAIDTGRMIDEGGWNIYQKRVLVLATAAILLDGLDNQMLGFAMPALITSWNISRESFVPIVMIGLLVMSVGGVLGGLLGDRIGRRPSLIGAVGIFGLATAASAFANTLAELAALRFISTFALGAALPNATAIVSEFSPLRRRSLAVSISMLSVAIGGLLGGVLSAWLLPLHGWRSLFMVSGALTISVAVTMVFMLPESPRFISLRPHRHRELDRILRSCGLALPARYNVAVPERSEAALRKRALFVPPLLRDTIAISTAFFCALVGNYLVFNWAPTMLTVAGYGLAVSSVGLGAYNMGGVCGALIGATLMDRLGARRPMLAMAGLGGIFALLVGHILSAGPQQVWFVVGAFCIQGAFVAGLQVMIFSLAVQAYPAPIRALGVGVTLSTGRLGAIAGAGAGAMIVAAGIDRFFQVVGIATIGVGAAVLIVKLRKEPPAKVRLPMADVPPAGG